MALLPSTRICGAAVTDTKGEPLGTITDFMVDHEHGGIAYAVFARGGLLGIGEKLFAIPWNAFTVEPLAGSIQLDVTAAALDAAKGIDRDVWPAHPLKDWLA